MLTARNVAPRGLPTWWRWAAREECWEEEGEGWEESGGERRNSWVTAIPMEAKESEVRRYERYVRSVRDQRLRSGVV